MKRALVTGCSKGIGLAITRALLAEGWAVLGVSRTMPPPAPFEHAAFDWTRVELSIVDQVDDTLGPWLRELPIDALIHCAAVQGPVGPLETSDPLEWANAVGTNLLGAYNVVRTALPSLKRADDGRILLFSGGGAFGPRPRYSAYAASKAGVVALTETLAAELAGTSVTVNCVAPGFVPTTIHAATIEAGPERAGLTAYREAVEGAMADDGSALVTVLDCVLHLLGPDATGLTGKTISAVHDAWRAIIPETVEIVNAAPVGRVERSKIPSYVVDGPYCYSTAPNGGRVRFRR